MNTSNYMDPISVKSAVDILIDRLTQAIIDGTLKPGFIFLWNRKANGQKV